MIRLNSPSINIDLNQNLEAKKKKFLKYPKLGRFFIKTNSYMPKTYKNECNFWGTSKTKITNTNSSSN